MLMIRFRNLLASRGDMAREPFGSGEAGASGEAGSSPARADLPGAVGAARSFDGRFFVMGTLVGFSRWGLVPPCPAMF